MIKDILIALAIHDVSLVILAFLIGGIIIATAVDGEE